jgi:hypothetical protein
MARKHGWQLPAHTLQVHSLVDASFLASSLFSFFFLFFFFWIGCGSCMCVCNERNSLRNPSLCGCAAGDSPPSVIVRRSVEGTPLVASAWGFPPLVVPVSPLVESND